MLKGIERQVEKDLLSYIGHSIEDYDGNVIPIYSQYDKKDRTLPAYAELRLQGPIIENPARGHYIARVQVNILLTFDVDKVPPFFFREVVGNLRDVLDNSIPVKGYGVLSRDTDRSTSRGSEIWDYGALSETLRVQQGIVETHYKMRVLICQ